MIFLQLSNNNASNTELPEIIIQVTSQGGPVSEYGLASYALSTLRKNYNNTITIFIDTVAASGGYLLACQGNKIYATPSSIVGSIGVLSQSINFYKLLDKFGIYNKVFRSDNAKSPITPLGPIPDNGEEIMQRLIDRIHVYFKKIVQEQPRRQQQDNTTAMDDIEDIIYNGDVFLGEQALEYNLIDGIMSSEEYITDKINNGYNIYKIIPIDHRNRHALLLNSLLSSFNNDLVSSSSSSTVNELLKHSMQFMIRFISDTRKMYFES